MSNVFLTTEEGQYLLLSSKSFSLPEKLGSTKFEDAERVEASLQVLELWKALKGASPLALEKRKMLFGPPENWRQLPGSADAFAPEDIFALVEVDLSEDAKAGALWCCLESAHPLSSKLKPNDVVDSVFLPIAKKLGREKELSALIQTPKTKKSRWDAV